MPRFMIGALILWIGSPAFAQTQLPNSRESQRTVYVYSPQSGKAKKYKRPNVKHTPRYEFYDRVEKAAHEKKKVLKKLYHPQFADPRYFGHKKIPKRRIFFKMKYCAQCGIRH